MIPYPNIREEIFVIGNFAIRWYGLMYVIGYVIGFHVLKARIRCQFFKVPMDKADSFITHLVIGMLIGARLVYVFVYNWPEYSADPISILYVHHGGLSFHGAALGMILASLRFAKKNKIPGYSALDTLAIGACLGLFLGRIGNFINSELYGRVSDVPWAMIFPKDPEKLPRHPSQIYQGLTEGVLLFFCLAWIHGRMKTAGFYQDGRIGAAFLMLYGIFRFFTEFTRQPDKQLGFVLSVFSMGQILCIVTFIAGVLMWLHVQKVSPKMAYKKSTLGAPKSLDFWDRYIGWPLEKALARFVG